MLEAVVALPDQLFYNTGISTYFWVVTNRKEPRRRGKVQLIDVRESYTKLRKSLGQKRKEIAAEQIDDITRLYGAFQEGPRSKIFSNESSGFLRITVERPLQLRWEITEDTLAIVESHKAVAKLDSEVREALLDTLRERRGDEFESEDAVRAVVRAAVLPVTGSKATAVGKAVAGALAIRDPSAPVQVDGRDNRKPDPELRDHENIPLPPLPVTFEANPTTRIDTIEYRTAVNDYFHAEVLPYVPDAWPDSSKTKIGYEIPLTRHFYTYTPRRPIEEIDEEIACLEAAIQDKLAEVRA